MTIDAKIISANLKHQMAKAKMNAHQLHLTSRVGYANILAILAGRRMPTLPTLSRFAKALRCDVLELLS